MAAGTVGVLAKSAWSSLWLLLLCQREPASRALAGGQGRGSGPQQRGQTAVVMMTSGLVEGSVNSLTGTCYPVGARLTFDPLPNPWPQSPT